MPVPRSRTLSLSRPLELRWTLPSIISSDPTRKSEGDGLRLSGRVDGDPFQLSLRVVGLDLEAEAWGDGADRVLADLSTLVGADDDASGFEPTHRFLRQVWRAHPGMRMGATGRPMDALVVAVLGQKVTTVETTQSLRSLVGLAGEPAPGPPGLGLLPTPEVLRRMAYHDLHPMGVERRRAETLHRVAKASSLIEAAAREGSEALDRALQRLQGIGPWTSALVRDRALGDPDAVLVGDYHMPNTVAFALAGEPRADDARMLELLDPYVGHRARVIRLIKASGVKAPRYGPRVAVRDFRGM